MSAGSVLAKAFPIATESIKNLIGAFQEGSERSEIFGTAVSGLWNVIANHPIISTVGAIYALVKAFDLIYGAADRANEKMSNSLSAYDTAKQNVIDVNTQLDQTKASIDELSMKDSLTFVEENELAKLEKANELLTIQKKIAEEEESKAARKAAADTITAYNKNFTTPINEETTQEYYNTMKNGNTANMFSAPSDISSMIAGIRYLKELQSEMEEGSEEWKSFEASISSAADKVLIDQMKLLSQYKESLEAVPYDDLEADQKLALESIDNTIDYIYKELDPATFKQMQFDKIFDNPSLMKMRKELVKLAEDSNNAGVAVSDIPKELADAVVSSGFTLDELIANINSQAGIIDVDKSLSKAKEDFAENLEEQLSDEEIDVETDVNVEPDVEIDKKNKSDILAEFNSWVDGLSEEDKLIVAKAQIELDETSGWTQDDWQDYLEKSKQTLIEESEPIADSFSSIFESALNPDIEDSPTVNEAIDDFQKKISTIQEALDNLEAGKEVDLTDLTQDFPDLANQAENLQQALSQLKADQLMEFADKWRQATSKLSGADAEQAQNFLKNLVAEMDWSSEDMKAIEGLNTTLADMLTEQWSEEEMEIIDRYQKAIEAKNSRVEKLVGNVDVNHRPVRLNADGSHSTVESETFNFSDFGIDKPGAFNVTPILPNGDTIENLEDYIYDILDSGGVEALEGSNIFLGAFENLDAACDAAETLHEEQEAMYEEEAAALVDITALADEYGKNFISPEKEGEINEFVSMVRDAYASIDLDNLIQGEGFTTRISDYQSKMENLMAVREKLNKSKGKLDTSDIEEAIDLCPELINYLDDIEGGVDELSETANNDILGYLTGQIERLREVGRNADADALQQYTDTIIANANTIEQTFIKLGQLKIPAPGIEGWRESGETENPGDLYKEMVSGLKEAKELYENGEIGLDDFKSFAKVISPTGSDDPVNFLENLGKAERYLTEDASGVQNFLEDMEQLGYATRDGESWTYSFGHGIEGIQEAADKAGVGLNLFLAMLGRIEDYGGYNDFFETEEEGMEKLDSLYGELAEEQRHLAEIKANPNTEGYDTAVEQSEAKIEELRQRIASVKEGIDDIGTDTPEEIADRAAEAVEMAQYLQEQIDSSTDEMEKAALQSELDDIMQEYHLTVDVDGNFTSLEEAASNLDLDINFDASSQDIDSEIGKIADYIAQMQGGSIEMDFSKMESAQSILTYLLQRKQELERPSVMDIDDSQLVDTSTDVANAITSIQDLQTAYDNLQVAIGQEENGMTVDTSEAQAELDAALEKVLALDEETQKKLGLNFEVEGEISTEDIMEQIKNMDLSVLDDVHTLKYRFDFDDSEGSLDDLIEKLGSLPDEPKDIVVTVDLSQASQTGLDNLKTALAEYQEANPSTTVQLFGVPLAKKDADSVIDKMGEVDKADAEPTISVNDQASGVISSINTSLDNVINKSLNPITIRINTERTTTNKTVNVPVSNVRGKNNTSVSGVAKANGDTKFLRNTTKKRGVLTGELGPEMVVDPQEGTYYTVGDNGPEIVSIPDNAIVFNHLQTEDLLRKGHTPSRGRALASGTAMADTTPGRLNLGGNKGYKDSVNADSSKAIADNLSSAATSAKGIKDSLGGADDNADDAKEKAEELYDFIVERLDDLQAKTDKFIYRAENATKLSRRLRNYQNAIGNVQTQIDTSEKAKKRYKQEANAVDLSKSMKKKVRNGEIDITRFDTSKEEDAALVEKINQYKEWHDKVEDLTESIRDLKEQQKELAKTKLDAIVDRYDLKTERSSAKIDTKDARLAYREAAGKSNVSNTQKAIYESQKNQEASILDKTQKALNAYQAELKKQMDAGLIKKGDDTWREAQIQIEEYNKQIWESKTAMAELDEQIRAIKTTKLQRVLDAFQRAAEQISKVLNLKQARGQNVTETDYMSQITTNNDVINAQYALAQNYMNEQAGYAVGSEKYQELAEKIAACKTSILDLLAENENLKDSIVEVRWKPFEDLQDDIDNSITELDFLMDMMDEAVDSSGNLTGDGYGQIALIAEAMKLERQTIVDYQAAIGKLAQDLANGNISQEEFNEKQREFQGIIRDSAADVKDYEQKLIDVWIKQAETRNSMLQEEISLRQDALKSMKDYHDYANSVKEKTKDINALKAQIAALQGVSDAASQARLRQLQAQLAESQEDLDDVTYEHNYNLKLSGYDTLKDEAQKQLDMVLNSVDTNSEMQQTIVNNMLDLLKSGYADAYDEIDGIIQNSGVVMSDMTNGVLSNMKSVADQIKQLMEETGLSSEDAAKLMENGFGDIEEMIQAVIRNTGMTYEQATQYVMDNLSTITQAMKRLTEEAGLSTQQAADLIGGGFDKLESLINAMVQRTGMSYEEAANLVMKNVSSITSAMSALTTSAGLTADQASALINGGLASVEKTIKTVMQNTGKTYDQAATDVQSDVTTVTNAVKAIVGATKMSVTDAVNFLSSDFATSEEAVKALVNKTGVSVDEATKLVEGYYSKANKSIIDLVKQTGTSLDDVKNLLTNEEFTGAIAGIGSVMFTTGETASKAIQELTDKINDADSAMATLAENTGKNKDTIKGYLEDEKFLGAFNAVKDTMTTTGESAADAMKTLSDNIGSANTGIKGLATSMGTSVADIVTKLTDPNFTNAVSGISNITSNGESAYKAMQQLKTDIDQTAASLSQLSSGVTSFNLPNDIVIGTNTAPININTDSKGNSTNSAESFASRANISNVPTTSAGAAQHTPQVVQEESVVNNTQQTPAETEEDKAVKKLKSSSGTNKFNKLILNNYGKKANKSELAEHHELWQYLNKKYSVRPNDAFYETLRDIMGLTGNVNKDLKTKMLKYLKKAGYSQGGYVNDSRYIPVDPSTILGKAIRDNGDDGIATLSKGEYVLNKDQVDKFISLINPAIASMDAFTNLTSGSLPNISPVSTQNQITFDSVIKVMGNVDADVYPGLETLAKQLMQSKNFTDGITKTVGKNVSNDAVKLGLVRRR